MLAQVCLGLLRAGPFGVVHLVWEILSVCVLKHREISPTTLIHVPGALLENKIRKQNNGSHGFKNQGALKFTGTKITLTMRLTRARLN